MVSHLPTWTRLLGVIVDSKLNWTNHYSHVIKTCTNTLSFIRRNLPKAPRKVKNTCYTTLVRPEAEYACVVWDPHHKIHIENIEKIQKSAARFVTNNYVMESGTSAANLKSLSWKTLEEWRIDCKIGTLKNDC